MVITKWCVRNTLPFTGASSWWGHSSVVTTLAEAELTSMCKGMEAAFCGLSNVVVELIRPGTSADVSVSVIGIYMWLPVAAGSTALHFATTSMEQYCNSNGSDLCK